MSYEMSRLAEGDGLAYTAGADLTGYDLGPTSGVFTMPGQGALHLSVAPCFGWSVHIRADSVDLKVDEIGADVLSSVSFSLPVGETFSIRFSSTGTVRQVTLDWAKGGY